MTHEEVYGHALEALRVVFSDTSVSKETTYRSLAELRDEIDAMLDTLEDQ